VAPQRCRPCGTKLSSDRGGVRKLIGYPSQPSLYHDLKSDLVKNLSRKSVIEVAERNGRLVRLTAEVRPENCGEIKTFFGTRHE
jgi:hypothetical protein